MASDPTPILYEFMREPWFSGPPCNNDTCETFEEIVAVAQKDGWEFVSVIPGADHAVAEHVTPPQLLFRRPKLQCPLCRSEKIRRQQESEPGYFKCEGCGVREETRAFMRGVER